MLKLAEAAPMSFMLESVTGGEVRGRYSIVGMKPDLIWDCRDGQARINRQARFSDEYQRDDRPALDSLRALISESRIAEMPEDVPPVVAVLDGVKGEVTLCAPAWHDGSDNARAAYARAAERVMDALRSLDRQP